MWLRPDLDVMKTIAEAAATGAAKKVADELRVDMRHLRDELRADQADLKEDLLNTLRSEIQAYHGDMTPTEHALAHDRLNWLITGSAGAFQWIWTNLGGLCVTALKWLLVFLALALAASTADGAAAIDRLATLLKGLFL